MRASVGRFLDRHPRIGASIVTAMGLVVLLGGVGGYIDDRDLTARGVTTQATVVSAYPGRDPAYDVRFTLPGGQVVTERTDYASNGARVGDAMRIEYDPQDPSTVSEVGARSAAWILWGTWLLTGAGLSLWSLRLWFKNAEGAAQGDGVSPPCEAQSLVTSVLAKRHEGETGVILHGWFGHTRSLGPTRWRGLSLKVDSEHRGYVDRWGPRATFIPLAPGDHTLTLEFVGGVRQVYRLSLLAGHIATVGALAPRRGLMCRRDDSPIWCPPQKVRAQSPSDAL